MGVAAKEFPARNSKIGGSRFSCTYTPVKEKCPSKWTSIRS
jgi:hypothetical protein